MNALWDKGRAEEASTKRVLVCDDELHIVRLIQVNLERQGYKVVPAHTGEEALAKVFSQRFDLAVIDADLPDMTGREVIARIRANPDTAHMRLVLIGKDHDRDDDDDSAGPDLHLSKPFHPMELVR